MSAHTPGPWSVDECRSGFAVYAYESGDAVVRTEDDEGRFGTISNEANARLIAAAPELLEALSYCESWFSKHSPTASLITGDATEHPMLTCIRAAIAKATGGDA